MTDDPFNQWLVNHLPMGFLAEEYQRFLNCDEVKEQAKFKHREPISNQEIAQLHVHLTKYGIKNLIK